LQDRQRKSRHANGSGGGNGGGESPLGPPPTDDKAAVEDEGARRRRLADRLGPAVPADEGLDKGHKRAAPVLAVPAAEDKHKRHSSVKRDKKRRGN
jgi:hypothetical protein